MDDLLSNKLTRFFVYFCMIYTILDITDSLVHVFNSTGGGFSYARFLQPTPTPTPTTMTVRLEVVPSKK